MLPVAMINIPKINAKMCSDNVIVLTLDFYVGFAYLYLNPYN